MVLNMKYWMLLLAAALLTASCGDAEPVDDTPRDAQFGCETCVDARADSLGLAEPSYLAIAVLQIASEYDLETLDAIPHLDRRAAANIVAQRRLTGDFRTIRQLDEVPWVGTFALAQLAHHATSNNLLPYCGDGELQESLETCDDGNMSDADECPSTCQQAVVKVHGLVENSYEALAILNLVNTLEFEELDQDVSLDRRAARGIVAARSDLPIGSLRELDEIPWVASRAFSKLMVYANERKVIGYCGDGAIQANEACDDGNTRNGDGCNRMCSFAAACELGAIDDFAADLEALEGGNGTRSIERGSSLRAFLNREFPADLVGARCFGISEDSAPDGAAVDSRAATLHQVGLIFEQYANSASRLIGAELDAQRAREELACIHGPGARFTGCRLDFEPAPFSGVSQTFVQSEDGATTLIFESSWSE